ncbi:uncharacterized protein SPAPADRAFT_59440 [Spathaspora passalidarum NRRL Y-27907]|uniref:Transporter n=1 Tax=Spathaspora passalidarum (strain NRRL Y-27907 / 11-Y1) TaxID=619300 RepID=G3AJX7_SPAPN|nr:uncharacterized protein SPAPADRAFT_59440 [Spathaspora passalidarum NRRL Y-27907]EGW34028.1 hypothetical protein SPAPADRAFT_59440 [Spathaspora passalidarum NRRL Y-27907]
MLNLILSVQSAVPDLSFIDITLLTFEAVLEVVIICFAGFIAAHSGILTNSGQKVLSALNVDLFTPCLVLSKLASSLSIKKIADIIIIPIFYAVSTGIAYLCSRFTSYLLSLNEPETDFVTAMAVFGNSNSLPVSLTLTLAYTLPDLLWDDIEGDTNDGVASRGILYLLIFQQLGQVLRWSWGFNTLLRRRSRVELNTYYTKNGVIIHHDETTTLLNDEQTLYMDGNTSQDSSIEPQQGQESVVTIDPTKGDEFLPWYKNIKNLPFIKQFLAFMNPPLYAMLVSVVIASVPALQNAFFGNNDSFIHNTVTKSVTALGSVSIPLILIVLGSNLYPSSDIPPASKHYKRILIGSLLSRMILPSLFLLPIIALCVKFINVSILDDPIFLIVAFILTISPPAIQLSQISTLNEVYQKEMAGVLFWGYVVLTLPSTIFIVVCSLEVLKWAR